MIAVGRESGRLPDYVSTKEAAQLLGYHVERVREMVREGKLRADKKGRTWWVYRAAVEDYQKSIEGKSKHDPTRGQ